MNFRHLKIFLTVCETGNMTQAARDLYMAQPSVSQAITELEKEFDVHLFERLNHRLYLTSSGEILKSYAHHILNLANQARNELAGQSQAGSLRIGASLTIGAYVLPGIISAFSRENPDVQIFTQVDNTTLIEKLLLTDQLDLGFVEGPIFSPFIIEEACMDDCLIFIASPNHPLAHRLSLAIQDLAGESFIMREAGSGTQMILENALQAAGISWRVAGIYNNIGAIKEAVIANLGIAVVSEIAIPNEIQKDQLVHLNILDVGLKRKFNLVYHRQKYITSAMQTFMDLVRHIN